MDKYQEFVNAVNTLEDEKQKKYCYSFIAQTRIYVGTYQQYKKWRKNIWDIIEQYFVYDNIEKIAKQRKEQIWDVFERFVMYMYYTEKKHGYDDCYEDQISEFNEYVDIEQALLKKYGIHNKQTFTFSEFLNTVFSDASKLEHDLDVELDRGTSDDASLEKKVELIRNTFNKWEEFQKISPTKKEFTKQQLVNMEKLEKAVKTYKEMNITEITLSDYPIKDCFNEVYSEEQINELIAIIKEKPSLIFMYLTPMINELIGDRSLVKGIFASYESKLRSWTIPKYKEKCREPIEQFQNVMDELVKRYDTYHCNSN